MTDNPCEVCTRPAPNATICQLCGDGIAKALWEITGHDVPIPADHPEVADHRRRHGDHCEVDPKAKDENRRTHGDTCPPLPTLTRWVPGLAENLDVMLARQDRVRIGPGLTTKVLPDLEDHGVGLAVRKQPMPYNVQASITATAMRRAVTDLAEAVAVGRRISLPTDDSTGSLANWLLPSVEWVRQLEDAGRHHRALTDTAADAERHIDNAPERRFAGPCWDDGPAWQVVKVALRARGEDPPEVCPGQLYASPDADFVTCPECGNRSPFKDRRAWLLGEAEDRLATIHDLSHLLAEDWCPQDRCRDMLDGYVRRGRLASHGVDGTLKQRPTYRVGDARLLLTEAWERKNKRQNLSVATGRIGA